MSKTNKKSINLSLKILAVFAFALIFVPFNQAAAEAYGANTVYQTNGTYYGSPIDQAIIETNPSPSINSINPRSSNIGVGTKTVTITGNGFFPGSITKINSINRATTFIDASHLLVQITGNDTNLYRTNGGFYITVFNGGPGGGYSNAAFFTVNSTTPATINNNSNYTNYTNTNGNSNSNTIAPDNFTDTSTNTGNVNGANDNYSNLASNAIFGSNSFLPSGIVQWVLFAIIILLIVIIVRKVFGAKQNYEESPMKHE